MINHEQKLNHQIFDRWVGLASMRAGAGEGLVRAGELDKQVVGLCADLAESVGMEAFKLKFPDRYIEVGVAEQNLATVASGLAAMGKKPFMASYAVFSPGRNWEQVRTTICYNNVPVKIIGSHVGLNVGPDGGSHQALEDIALMRTLPRMTVISPCDAIEAKKAVIAAAKTKEPTYIRLVREKSPIITTIDTPFVIGKAQIVWGKVYELGDKQSTKNVNIKANEAKSHSTLKNVAGDHANKVVGIIATGPLLHKALTAAKKLEEDGHKVIVMNLATIKPLDIDAIVRLAHQTRGIVTVEEHQLAGGMGSAVAECLAEHFPVPIEFIAVRDEYGQSGTAEELLEHYGLTENAIINAVHRVLLRK